MRFTITLSGLRDNGRVVRARAQLLKAQMFSTRELDIGYTRAV